MAITHPSVPELLEDVFRHAYHSAGLEVNVSWRNMEWESPLACVTELLDTLSPFLAPNTIRELYIDNLVFKGWVGALSRFIYSCISGVTTLHCVESQRPDIPDILMLPCTAALRILIQLKKPDAQARSPESELEPHDSASDHRLRLPSAHRTGHNKYQSMTVRSVSRYILPMLNTVVVSMCVTGRKKRRPVWKIRNDNDGEATVHAWWDELIKALTCRRDIGLPIRTLRIIGGWATEKLRARTARMDGEMLSATAELVNELIDERRVNPAL